MRELSTVIFFRRLDGTYGRAKRADCEGWPRTRVVFRFATLDPIVVNTFDQHHGADEPTLFRTPDGVWFRRLAWHECPSFTLKPPLYVEVDRQSAHEWLAENRYDLPAPINSKAPRRGSKGDQCLGIYMDAVARNETPPTVTEIARRVGCNKGTASRALHGLEPMRRAMAKGR